jgi:membrane protease YdiL (CAAX protease family)
MASCAECSATLYGDAEWCLQCFAPVGRAVPSPFAPRAAAAPTTAVLAPPAPPSPPVAPPPWARPVTPPSPTPPPVVLSVDAKQAEGKVAVPLGVILAIGFLFQVGAYAYARWGNVEPSRVISVGMWVTLGFYGLVLAIVAGASRRVDFLPLWSRGRTQEGVAIGVFGGVATAATVLLLLRGASGRLQVAPDVKFALGDATPLHVLLAVAVLVVAAPLVEELLFRGFVAEAMRHRGAVIALLVSGVLFALWHMRLGGLLYYTILGVLLGVLYWKRGLSSSIAAHAAFNGTLVVVALAFIVGQGTVVNAQGMRVELPGGWERQDAPFPGAVLYASGPSGSDLLVMKQPMEGGRARSLEDIAADLGGRPELFPGIEVEPGSTRIIEESFGRAVQLRVDIQGHAGEVVVTTKGSDVWIVALGTGGSSRAEGDFGDILDSLRLP